MKTNNNVPLLLPDGSTMLLNNPKLEPKEMADVKISRAERRRMKHDPLFHQKIIAGSEYVDEYARLIAFGQILVSDMFDLQLKMSGLAYTPKKFRAERQETLTQEWNVIVEKLQNTQTRMEEIEKERNKESVAPDLLKNPE
jgi:hypothetical protein